MKVSFSRLLPLSYLGFFAILLGMIIILALLIVAAVFSTKISSRFGVPLLIVFLAIGMIVGSDGLKIINFSDAALSRRIADILLIFIIFEGGFQTKQSAMREVRGPALSLATLGVFITAMVLGLLVWWFTEYDLLYSLMIGSIISSTDAAAVLMITRQNPIQPKLSTTIEVESAANDPMAIMLTIAFIEAVTGKTNNVPRFVIDLLWRFCGGVGVGFIVASIAPYLFNRLESENRGYYYVLGMAIPLLCYGAADAIGANGIISAFFGAYFLGTKDFAFKKGVGHFLEGVSAFCNVALFLTLGLLVSPGNFKTVWQEGVMIALLVMLVARPVAFFLCTIPFKYTWSERLFIIWGGIKGAVPIVLGTYPAVYGIDPQGRVFNIVFFAVLLSCLMQGSTLGGLARLLKLTVPRRQHSPYSMELHTSKYSDVDLIEIDVEEGSAAAGKPIKDIGLPETVLISSIVRGQKLITPKGDVTLQAGDLLSVLSPRSEIDNFTQLLTGKDC